LAPRLFLFVSFVRFVANLQLSFVAEENWNAITVSGGVRYASTGCLPGAPEPRFLGRDQAPPGALPAKPEAAFGGPARGESRSLRVFAVNLFIH